MRPSRFFVVMLSLSVLAIAPASVAQTVKTVTSFSSTTGQYPAEVVLTQGRDGNTYGTTARGGTAGFGVVFKQRTAGSGNVVLHNFSGPDGEGPQGGVLLAQDGNYYGSAVSGGTYGYGVLFKITSSGTLTVLYNFSNGSDGSYPTSPPIQGTDGNFYGTTNGDYLIGSVLYTLTAVGSFSTIYTFDTANGRNPIAPPLQSTDGSLYVAAITGGAYGCGAVLRLTTAGVLKAARSFDCGAGGATPIGPLVQAADGNIYGTTQVGGRHGEGTIFKINGTTGLFTTVYSFGATPTDGQQPLSGLTQGTDGNLYGTTVIGGKAGAGSIFELSGSGVYSQVYSFPAVGGVTQQQPEAAPMQSTTGTFYGVTYQGGANGLGSVYTLNAGLGPFVTFVGSQGRVGQTAQILGQGLTGTTSVTFNGVPAATFKVFADTYMTAVVPSGATTGKVVVTTPGGALTSNVNFRVVN